MLPLASRVSGAQTSGQSYDTITLSAGETRTIVLDDGETFENKLVDVRADDCHLRINTNGNVNDFAIRNVGFVGIPQDTTQKHVFNLAGNGVVENIFLDGRRRDGVAGTEMGAIRMKRGHSGRIVIRNTFIAGMGNNGSYASSAGKNDGGNGTVIYENCYHRDNTVSNYRPGTEGSRIRNCVSIANDPDGLRGGYPFSGSKGCRGAWVKSWPDQRIENSAFYMSPNDCNPNGAVQARHFHKSDGPGVEVTVVDTGINADAPTRFVEENEDDGYANIITENVHDNPTVDVIQDGGVPLNPEMAASGLREMPPPIDEIVPAGGMDSSGDTTSGTTDDGSSDSTTDTHTLTVDGTDAGHTDYAFTVGGEISDNPDVGSLGTGDSIDGSSASGFVNGGVDGYLYTGELTDLTVDGGATVLVDGQAVDPANYGDSTAGGRDHELVVLSTEDPSELSYEFTTTGGVDLLLDNGDNSAEESNDTITQNDDGTYTVTGYTGNGYGDGFAFDGELVDVSPTEGPIEVLVDGKAIDLSQFDESSSDGSTDDGRDHELVVLSTEDPSELSYEFTTTGGVDLLLDNGDNSAEESNDTITQNDDGTWTVSGYTGNGYGDGFAFDGELVDVSPTEGPIEVLVDGQTVDLSQFDESSSDGSSGSDDGSQLPNKIVIDGRNSGRTDYSFTIDGEVAKSADLGSVDDGDTVTNGTIEGFVDGEVDGYRYSGNITDFSIDGDAAVTFRDVDG